MARSGGGRTSGSHSVGSGRGSSSSRSSSTHRTSGSHRSTSSRSSSSKTSSRRTTSGSRRSGSGFKLPLIPHRHNRRKSSGGSRAVLNRLTRQRGRLRSGGSGISLTAVAKPVLALIAIVVLISFAGSFFGRFSGSEKPPVPAPAKTVENASTVYQIKPLDPSLAKETAYYEDKLGWLTEDVDIMEEQLKIFQAVTGIHPFVYLTDEADYQANGENLYDTLFDDEAHFLLIIEGKLNSKGEEVWNAYYYQGTDAAGVMNDNIISMFWDNYDYNYGLDSSDAQCIGYTFSHTATALTVVSEDNDIEKPSPVQGVGPAPVKKTSSVPMIIAALALIAVIIIVILLAVANYRKTMSFDLPDDDSIEIPDVVPSPYDPVDAPVRAVEWDDDDDDEPAPAEAPAEEASPAATPAEVPGEEPTENSPAPEAPAAKPARPVSSSMNIPSFLGAHMDITAPEPEAAPAKPAEAKSEPEAPETSGGYYLNGVYYPGDGETNE